MSISLHKAVAIAALAFTAVTVPGTAHAESSAPSQAARPMTSSSITLRLPDGKHTVHLWKTWYQKSNGKYHGHYGFTKASAHVHVKAILWTSGKIHTLAKGKTYSYSNESKVRLDACDTDYANDTDCVYW